MAKSNRGTKTTRAKSDREMIKDAYKEYMLLEGHKPASVFKFMRDLKMEEPVFYNYFGSFQALERAIWKDYCQTAINSVKSDKVYDTFSSREKLLSFYYTLLEVLKNDRSFVSLTAQMPEKGEFIPQNLRGFKEAFIEYVQEVINEGRESDEIKDRKYLSDRYKDGLWLQTMFIINFWLKDDSEGFEKTDAAIEKAVNLSYDLMGAGPLDKMFDFAKFLYQNRV